MTTRAIKLEPEDVERIRAALRIAAKADYLNEYNFDGLLSQLAPLPSNKGATLIEWP